MKKGIVFILIIALALGMAACGSGNRGKTISHLDLNVALQEAQYATRLVVGGSALEATMQELELYDVNMAATVSFMKETDDLSASGFAYVFSFADESAAVSAFATLLKMCVESGISIQTVESKNGRKAVYQAGNTAATILSQAENTIVYATEHSETDIKNGIYKAGIGKILENLGY